MKVILFYAAALAPFAAALADEPTVRAPRRQPRIFDLAWGGEPGLSPEAAAAPRMAPMPNTLQSYNRRDPAPDAFVVTPGLPAWSQPRHWKPLARYGDDVFYIVPVSSPAESPAGPRR